MTTPDRTPADFGWTGQVKVSTLWEPLRDENARVTLGMVASAHRFVMTRPDVRDEARLLKRCLRAKFEQQQGTIRNSYFCERLTGAIAMIEQPIALHTVLNSADDRLVALEADCNALAHQTKTAYGRSRAQQPLVDGIYSAMTRVLAAADVAVKAAGAADPPTRAASAGTATNTASSATEPTESDGGAVVSDAARELARSELSAALATAETEVEHVSKRVRVAVQRQARFVYFQGALAGTAFAIVVCVVLGMVGSRYWANHIDTAALVASALFGALGAVVSVIQRISAGRLTLDFNASVWQLLSVGGLRPLVGAIFGTVAQFALGAGLFGVGGVRPESAIAVFALIGFAAGFSERFATDMVERAGRVLTGPPDAQAGQQPPQAL